ncbi:Sec-independent protein translocase protein TatB [Maricaulis sp.]|uniref:Sec-independent protein translocase protein TatB n=1 Tax=Maricaulis sp. TaxID=1486257 RepID=UPI00260D303D|nr:Sec-independent protein translocase protein TatB [Maricaulis sp.]
MSPGIGMPEMLVVLVLALVVVGPQQLPVLMRRVGRMVGQARAMAREFQHSFEEIGRETELSELRKEIEALKKANPIEEIRGELDQVALEAQDEKIRQLKMSKADPFEQKLMARKAQGGQKPAAVTPAPATPAEDGDQSK